MRSKKPQLQLLQREKSAYGGELLKKDKNRQRGRPIVTNHTMHLVMRSTKAVGDWSFKKPRNEKKVREIIKKFARKYGVRILSLANVGNHLHMQIKLGHRRAYYAFIRAIIFVSMRSRVWERQDRQHQSGAAFKELAVPRFRLQKRLYAHLAKSGADT